MYCLHAAQDRAACKYFLCYAKAVNETGFINKVPSTDWTSGFFVEIHIMEAYQTFITLVQKVVSL